LPLLIHLPLLLLFELLDLDLLLDVAIFDFLAKLGQFVASPRSLNSLLRIVLEFRPHVVEELEGII